MLTTPSPDTLPRAARRLAPSIPVSGALLLAIAGTATLLAASIAAPRPAVDPRTMIEPVRLDGAARRDNSGYAVSDAGDVDGDGLGDILIGAPEANPGGGRDAAGQTFVVTGAAIAAASANGGVLFLGAPRGGPGEVGADTRRAIATSG